MGLSAIASLIIRTVWLVNWLSHRYSDMVWWLLWSINKQHSSVHSFLQFHTSFDKQVWVSLKTSECDASDMRIGHVELI